MSSETKVITAEEAQVVQNEMVRSGRLLIWTIVDHPTDYPDKYTCRPFAIQRGTYDALPFVLLADTLEDLRRQLPMGLLCLPRFREDEPKIVESWC